MLLNPPPGSPGYNGGNRVGVDPLLGPLGDYGGPTRTRPLLPGSLAVGGQNVGGGPDHPFTLPDRDQRGVERLPAVGAYWPRPFDVAVVSGDNQSTRVNTPFALPLTVRVSSAYGEPVEGGQAVFFVPGSDNVGDTVPTATLTSDRGGPTARRAALTPCRPGFIRRISPFPRQPRARRQRRSGSDPHRCP